MSNGESVLPRVLSRHPISCRGYSTSQAVDRALDPLENFVRRAAAVDCFQDTAPAVIVEYRLGPLVIGCGSARESPAGCRRCGRGRSAVRRAFSSSTVSSITPSSGSLRLVKQGVEPWAWLSVRGKPSNRQPRSQSRFVQPMVHQLDDQRIGHQACLRSICCLATQTFGRLLRPPRGAFRRWRCAARRGRNQSLGLRSFTCAGGPMKTMRMMQITMPKPMT